MKSQTERIADILERERRIDNFAAIHSRLTLRLGARIFDLKAIGYEIRTEQTRDKNTIYWLVAKPKLRQLSFNTRLETSKRITT